MPAGNTGLNRPIPALNRSCAKTTPWPTCITCSGQEKFSDSCSLLNTMSHSMYGLWNRHANTSKTTPTIPGTVKWPPELCVGSEAVDQCVWSGMHSLPYSQRIDQELPVMINVLSLAQGLLATPQCFEHNIHIEPNGIVLQIVTLVTLALLFMKKCLLM